jgi:ferrous iron transport protein A
MHSFHCVAEDTDMLPEYMLSDLPAGRSADVAQMDAPGPMGRRLLDIGFTEGTRVQCLYAAPSGEPRAYLVRGAVIALRREDAARVRLLEDSIWE